MRGAGGMQINYTPARVRSFLLTLIMVVAIASARAETSTGDTMNDLEAVKEAVFDYYFGVIQSDETRLHKAFAASVAHLTYLSAEDENGVEGLRVEEIEDSFKRWIAAEKDHTEGEIVAVDIIDGRLASVKFRFFIWNTNYLDLLTLYKVDGAWKIVAKQFVVIE
jgi:hypothetical protein